MTLERLSTLLPHPVWCRPVLLGLISSMGAVDASLSAAAGAALLAAVAGGSGGGVAAGAGAGGGLQEQVARLVVELWKHMGRWVGHVGQGVAGRVGGGTCRPAPAVAHKHHQHLHYHHHHHSNSNHQQQQRACVVRCA